jgi:protease IV
MTLTADEIVDRRRLRRKVSFWRVIAFLGVAAALVIGIFLAVGRDAIPELAGPQIARVTISGFISDDRDQLALLTKLAKTPEVSAVLIDINSTGGATAGGEALYEGLRKLAAAKPTVATIGTFGASAAYMAAIATDHVVARRTSLTGSIGVLFEFPEVSELMKTIGVSVNEIKSAPLKAEPSPFRPPSDEAKAVIESIVHDSYDWFVDIVAERRGLARPDALTLADGRVFSGRQALAANLIDEIGGEDAAIAWLASAKGVNAKLPIKDWAPKKDGVGGIFSSADAIALWLAQRVGIAPNFLRGSVIDQFLPDRLKLDGLMSVWQAPLGGKAGPAEGAPQ